MDFKLWLAFFLASWVIAISPGSGAVLSMSHGLQYGLRKTSATILGLQLGLMTIFVIAGAGVGSLLVASETAFTVVKVLGAAYLMYLGLRQFFSKPAPAQAVVAAEQRHDQQARTQAAQGWRARCLTGFITNATNPKGILFMVAVLPPFIHPERGSVWLQLLILGATLSFVDVVVMHGYAASASLLRNLLRSPRAQVWQNRIFGGLLVAIGGGLLAVRRSANNAPV